jgi:hypothetical protein
MRVLYLLIAFCLPACNGTGQIKIGGDDTDTDPCLADPDRPCTTVDQEWYQDGDNDGFGLNGSRPIVAATAPASTGWALVQGDCNDGDSGINPSVPEVCDGVDQNCNDLADDGLAECHPGDSPVDTDLPDTGETDPDTDPVIPTETGDSGSSDSGDSSDSFDSDLPEDTDPPPDTDPLETDIILNTDDPPPDTDIPDDTDPVLPTETGDSGSSDSGDSSAETGVPETDPPFETDQPPDTDLPDTGETDPDTDPVLPTDTGDSGDSDSSDTADSADTSAETDVPETDPPLETDIILDTDDPPIGYETYYRDADGDGRGVGPPLYAESPPVGYVLDGTDCDDSNPGIFIGADEICNGLDDDCDGLIDVDALDAILVYYDRDGDSQGSDEDDGHWACALEAGYSLVATDCDDSDPFTFEAGVALDLCGDGLDQNCDGNPDNNPGAALFWYTDYDGDGYGGLTGSTTASCGQPAFPHTSRVRGDCNDAAPAINPAAVEVCDELNLDEDCDGQADDDDLDVDPGSLLVYYYDGDGDGYGGQTEVLACDATGDLYVASDDCDDSSTAYSPAAPEWDDAADWNCDGSPWQELVSTTATGQVVQWVESWRGLGGDVPSALDWSSTGPQPINFGIDILGVGESLPPGPTPWMVIGAPSTGAGHNCARRTYAAVPPGEWAIGAVHQFRVGDGEPVVWVDGQRVSTGERHPQGQLTVFRAYGPITGDGGPHVVDICDTSSNGLQVARVGMYEVVRVP